MVLFSAILNINLQRIARSMLKNFHLSMNGPLKVGQIFDSEECIVLTFILLGFHPIIWFKKVEVLKVLLWLVLKLILIVMSLFAIDHNVWVGEKLFLLLLIAQHSFLI